MTIIIFILCLVLLTNFEVNGYESNETIFKTVLKTEQIEAYIRKNYNNHLNVKTSTKKIVNLQGNQEEIHNCYAVVRTNDPNSKFYGASGAVSVYNPGVASGQWSASRMRLSNSDESIEVGWMVNIDLFKDNKTHLYIRYAAGGKSCVNLDCPGFIHTGKEVHLGAIPDKLSERGEFSRFWRFYIEKGKDDGNWWVAIGEERYRIGYWLKSLFKTLNEVATQVEWGGEIYIPRATKPEELPFMGCGNKPDYDPKFAAYYMQTKLVDTYYKETIPPQGTVKVQNCDRWYNVLDADYQGPNWGRLILYGGPGVSH